jgi:hypothetical protein
MNECNYVNVRSILLENEAERKRCYKIIGEWPGLLESLWHLSNRWEKLIISGGMIMSRCG